MEEYNGEKDMEKFMSFCKQNAKYKFKPMSDERIKVICDAYPDKKIPKQFISFLKNAGDFFELWNGSDYILVDDKGCFMDIRANVKNDIVLDALFKNYGFSYDDCLFFFSHQGKSYCFFQLSDSDASTVYILDADVEPQQVLKTTFIDFLIDTYNSYVSVHEKLENPWRKCRADMAQCIIQDVMNKFNSIISIPYAFDKYRITYTSNKNLNFMSYLNPILKKCISTINAIYICSQGTMYLYFPNKNFDCNNSIKFNLYDDSNFIIDREYKWGWFTIKDKVYVFGDKFKALIEENIDKFNLSTFDKDSINFK